MIHIIMELVEGGELFDHIVEAGAYEEPKARAVMRMLLEALNHLHGIGIIHRDIKPENILCSSNGVDIKIADFGLSNSVSSSQQALRSQCGTPVYMAPEMLQKHPYGPSVDVSCSCRDERRHSWSCQAPHKLPADVRCLWGRSGPRGL